MSRPSRLSESLAAALVAALSDARWEAADLLARRGPEAAPDLLSGRAAELAFSPIADDQLLGLALEAAAHDLRTGRAALSDGVPAFYPGPGMRPTRRRRPPAASTRQDRGGSELEVLRELERRRRAAGLHGAELSARLASDARLQERLADDPHIAAPAPVRRRMRASVGPIAERARALDPNVVRDQVRRARRGSPFGAREVEVGALRRPPIVLGQADHKRLTELALDILLSNPRAAAPLLNEVERARVVADDEVPADAVRIGASVEFAEAFAGRVDRVTLVAAPQEREPGALSVLTSTGSALIGLSIGQTILWKDHFGLEQLLTVTDVRFDQNVRL